MLPAFGRIPRVGKKVVVAVGEPVPLDDLFARCACRGGSRPAVWAEITARLKQRLIDLQATVPEQNRDQSDRVPPEWRRPKGS